MLTAEELKSTLDTALAKLKSELTKSFSDQIKEVKKELKTLSTNVSAIKQVADDALKKAQDNETKLATFTEKFEKLNKKCKELEKSNTELSANVSSNARTIKSLEHKLEDSINRQCRKTLVFKGVKEERDESWQMTEQILAKKISEASNGETSEQTARNMIERAHRSRPNRFKKGQRDIYAALYDWKDTEYVQQAFTTKNIKDKKFKVYCEQKYGSITTARRNMALMARKTLKANGEITSGYIAYPAKLMVKYPGEKREAKFTLHEDFSNAEITPEKVVAENGELSAGE